MYEQKINQEEMLKYYHGFDPIEKKYRIYFSKLKKEKKEKAHSSFYQKFYNYECCRQLSELTKKEFGDIYANLKLIYADERLTEEIIEIYDLVYDKVINQYLNIDGMERLFSEKYINFEWEMHLGIDYAGHSMNFYRDHFIHQVRDAYSMDILLQHGYDKKIKCILGDEGSSKIARYVCKHIMQQMECNDNVKDFLGEKERKDFYLENIIYMSSYMSALFHDIGYPEVANMQSGRSILAYIANVYNFGSGYIDFDKIFTVLQNSLLFRVVSPSEVRKRIEEEKIDHGAVSALMFLLHFYENGAIYGLEPYKKCAVEIAGLAIYNHTNTYSDIFEKDDAKKALYQRSVFLLNPISYLLRICDDLQEWDRIYFEISGNANIILCNKCHTPIVRREWLERNDVYYLCNCNNKENKMKESGVFETAFRRRSFPYRRLYNVTVCRELVLASDETGNRCFFRLCYDLERLLYVAYINPSYAKYRIKELNQLKKMFVRQDIKEMTYIEYFMSANILLIKAQIVREYIDQEDKALLKVDESEIPDCLKEDKDFDKNQKEFHKSLKAKAQEIYSKKMEEIFSEFAQDDDLCGYLNENFWIYIYISILMEIGICANDYHVEKDKKDKRCEFVRELWKQFSEDKKYQGDVLFLLKDCCQQAVKMYDGKLSEYDYYPDKYFEQFKTDKGMEAYFFRFAHSDNYVPIKHRKAEEKYKLDAYTDLCCFKTLLQIDTKNGKAKETI